MLSELTGTGVVAVEINAGIDEHLLQQILHCISALHRNGFHFQNQQFSVLASGRLCAFGRLSVLKKVTGLNSLIFAMT